MPHRSLLHRVIVPPADTVSVREKLISGLAGLVAIGLVMAASAAFLDPVMLPGVVASMGASAVLLFAVPHGPLSQPWNLVGGHLISGAIGVSVAQLVPDLIVAASLAVGVSIAVMYLSRCLHPPGGATALFAVVGGAKVQALGFGYLLTPVLLNVVVMLAWALLINNLLGNRRYPEALHRPGPAAEAEEPDDMLAVAEGDLEQAMREMDEYLDVSVSDLGRLVELTASHAARRQLGEVTAGDIMTQDPVSIDYDTPVEVAWQQLAQHRVRALPVVDGHRRVIGILTIADFLNQVQSQGPLGLGERLQQFLRPSGGVSTDKPEYAGHLMTRHARTVQADQHVMELFPIYLAKGVHHLPVVNADGGLCGMITPRDLLRALYGEVLACGVDAERGA